MAVVTAHILSPYSELEKLLPVKILVLVLHSAGVLHSAVLLSRDATHVNRGIYALMIFRLHFQTRISTLHLYLQ